MEWTTIAIGTGASVAAGLATFAGALPAVLVRDVSERAQGAMLGFAAGVMLAASFFSLLVPALERMSQDGAGDVRAAGVAVAGTLLGAAAVWAVDRLVPHEHFFFGREGRPSEGLRRVWLFVFAIAIHNFPEGLAVGVGFAGGDVARGTVLAIGIGLQNVPEGLAVAVALVAQGYGRGRALLIALLTGLVEPVGGVLGVTVVSLSEPILPWGLCFAAGAMLFVVASEVIPETQRRGVKGHGSVGLMVGLAVMMFLDVTLA